MIFHTVNTDINEFNQLLRSINAKTSVLDFNEKNYEQFSINQKGEKDWTLLNVASAIGNLNLVDFFINLNADINSMNIFGWTPLFCAALTSEDKQAYAIAKKLILAGSNVNVYSKLSATRLLQKDIPRGATPLWVALELNKHEKLSKLLIQNNASLEMPRISTQSQTLLQKIQNKIARKRERNAKAIYFISAWKYCQEQNNLPLGSLVQDLLKVILFKLRDLYSQQKDLYPISPNNSKPQMLKRQFANMESENGVFAWSPRKNSFI